MKMELYLYLPVGKGERQRAACNIWRLSRENKRKEKRKATECLRAKEVITVEVRTARLEASEGRQEGMEGKVGMNFPKQRVLESV